MRNSTFANLGSNPYLAHPTCLPTLRPPLNMYIPSLPLGIVDDNGGAASRRMQRKTRLLQCGESDMLSKERMRNARRDTG